MVNSCEATGIPVRVSVGTVEFMASIAGEEGTRRVEEPTLVTGGVDERD